MDEFRAWFIADEFRADLDAIEQNRLALLADLRHESVSLCYDLLARDRRRGPAYLNGLTPDSPWWVGVEGACDGRCPHRSAEVLDGERQ